MWRVLRSCWREQAWVALFIALRVPAAFASPYGVKELLAYLELRDNPSSADTDRPTSSILPPYTSIFLIFFGPYWASLMFQWHATVQTTFSVWFDVALTQLVFEHSLRVRVGNDATESVTAGTGGKGNTKTGSANKNLIGKINNLVSSDLDNINGGRDFQFLCMFVYYFASVWALPRACAY